ncbi:twin-arginine translocation signal domain-containing protein, partial [Malaciobacter marinus]
MGKNEFNDISLKIGRRNFLKLASIGAGVGATSMFASGNTV